MTLLKLGHEDLELDPKHLEFNEDNLNEFLTKSHTWYAYYNEKCHLAQRIHSFCEDKYEEQYALKFTKYKSEAEKRSDKYCESAARADQDVVLALKKSRIAKYNWQTINGYLRAMERAMANSLTLAYNIRQEIKTLHNNTVYN